VRFAANSSLVIITFHGSDINNSYHRKFSKIAMRLSAYNIFVHKSIRDKVNAKNKYSIIPCGVNVDTFHLSNMMEARKGIHLDIEKNMFCLPVRLIIGLKIQNSRLNLL